MTRERWQQVCDLLEQALEIAPHQRPALLDRACDSDPSLRQEVEILLDSSDRVRSSFLQRPPLVEQMSLTESATKDVLTPGAKLGPYIVQSLIGAGGMGEVYRARDGALKRDVAIKVLPSSFSRDHDRLRRFQLEAEAAAVLNHPNILSIYHIGQQDDSPYIVTELLEGETLRERLRHGALKLRDAIDIAIQTAKGLAAAHEKGIVHRDLKPENLFVTKDGRVKILDFGLAKLAQPERNATGTVGTLDRDTQPGMVVGTVGYMSPEQVRGQNADQRADIFAFGAIAYEMLTGRRAFEKDTSADTMSAILQDDPPRISQVRPSVHPSLQRVVHRCLEKNPQQRFQSAHDIAFALEAVSDSSRVGMLPFKQRASTKKLVWIAAAVAAIVIAAAVIIWWSLPVPVPVVEAVTQLTDDGLPKGGNLVTDGSRIYFTEEDQGSGKIAQVSVAGGETSIIPTRHADMRVAGIAPDGSSLLVHVRESNWQLWTLPLPTGEARRLGTISAASPSYLPDGRLLFIQDAGLHVAERDGSNIQKLLTVPRGAACPTASPDGKIIVFAAGDSLSRYFEVKVDGSGVHEIMKGTADAALSCPVWTADGKHLIYEVVHQAKLSADIWAVAARTGLWRRYKEATQLTNGPLAYVGNSIPSRDGKQIFTIGIKPRGELVRYDQTTKQFVPFLGGISAIDPSFSRDGQWVAYTSTSDHTLWRSRSDGTDRLQLTFPPMQVAWPVISQDGRQVAFQVIGDGGYVISTNGGQPRRFADKNSGGGSLSPDGNSIAFAGWIRGKQGDRRIWELRTLNLTNGALSSLRSSQNVLGPFWVNQNTLVAAAGDVDQVEWTTKLVSFDLKTGKWTDLVSDAIVNWMPSPDGKYLYYATRGTEPRAMRIRLADRQVETLTSLKNLHRFWDFEEGTQISVAPDGSPVFTRDIGTREIYALTVKWP